MQLTEKIFVPHYDFGGIKKKKKKEEKNENCAAAQSTCRTSDTFFTIKPKNKII